MPKTVLSQHYDGFYRHLHGSSVVVTSMFRPFSGSRIGAIPRSLSVEAHRFRVFSFRRKDRSFYIIFSSWGVSRWIRPERIERVSADRLRPTGWAPCLAKVSVLDIEALLVLDRVPSLLKADISASSYYVKIYL